METKTVSKPKIKDFSINRETYDHANKEKNVLGMMPHPERMIDNYLSGEDGSIFFQTLINNLK